MFYFLQSLIQTVSKRGYLHKTGSERVGWKRRYCTIDNFRGLEYFKSDTVSERGREGGREGEKKIIG